MEDNLTQPTQTPSDAVDPRRMGRNNSGLSAEDVSDVMCILHPCSIAAFKVVVETAKRSPQHVLQTAQLDYDAPIDLQELEEQETFVVEKSNQPTSTSEPMDLAIRFSVRTVQPQLGFVFGRAHDLCDVVMSSETHKRVSNVHFSIFMNNSGVLMLKDMSTNGTMVDDTLLKGRNDTSKTRMLNPGSIIQLLSPNQAEILKFIVRIPSRDGHMDAFEAKFQAYIQRFVEAEMQWRLEAGQNQLAKAQFPPAPMKSQKLPVKAPLVPNAYGMRWNGGDKYNVVGQIGKGAFALVYQLATKSDGQLFAAKELEKRKFMKHGVLDRQLDNEMHIMRSINHPNVVQYIDYHDVADHLYIIMEFVACGDLGRYLNGVGGQSGHGALPEAMAKQMAQQVFGALEYLHDKKITHRDIKPDNILIADMDPDRFTVKLSDFGLSKVVKDNDTFLKTFCGTLLYCAPEVFPHYPNHPANKGVKRPRKSAGQAQPRKFHSYSSAVDIWSFGAVLWYSLCNKPPFEGTTETVNRTLFDTMFDKIMHTTLDISDLVKKEVSDECVSLLIKMLNTDPSARPSATYCLHHEWFGYPPSHDLVEESPTLGAIIEEEDEYGEEPDMAGLSLDENQGRRFHSEVSFNSSDIDFFDPRESKRVKHDPTEHPAQAATDALNPGPSYRFRPVIQDPAPNTDHPSAEAAQSSAAEPQYALEPVRHEGTEPKPVRAKLFGEISQSDWQNVNPHQLAQEWTASSNDSSAISDGLGMDNAQFAQPRSLEIFQMSSSLLGAESLVREMRMASSPSVSSNHEPNDTPNAQPPISSGPLTPLQTKPPSPQPIANPSEASPHTRPPSAHPSPAAPDVEATPKPKFNRQINLFPPVAMYTQPNDSKHTLPNPTKPLPPTTIPAPISAPTPLFGHLTSTPDSFTPITIPLTSRITSWGRGPSNTHIYPHPTDTRIPKSAMSIYFHAPGIEALAARGADWSALPLLHAGIIAHASYGLSINGVLLKKQDPPAYQPYGHLFSGDEILVWRRGSDVLKFKCVFFVGEGKTKRKGPEAFRVEVPSLAGAAVARKRSVDKGDAQPVLRRQQIPLPAEAAPDASPLPGQPRLSEPVVDGARS